MRFRRVGKRRSRFHAVFIASIGIGWFLLFLPVSISGEEAAQGKIPFSMAPVAETPQKTKKRIPWHQLDTRFTRIQYTHLDHLKQFDRKIDFSPGEFFLKSLFSPSDSDDMMGKLSQKIDRLYQRVQEILDMRKRSEKKVVIRLHADKDGLKEAYRELFGGELNVRAWYLFELNTIYINVDDVHEGMLAHEMAHSIIDNYFAVRPPRASAEILAVYVDTHLFRKTR